ncbi:hypothetical protein ACWDUL_29980 [Nocardia niigatensis]
MPGLDDRAHAIGGLEDRHQHIGMGGSCTLVRRLIGLQPLQLRPALLPGRTHLVKAAVLGPALVEFFG